MLPPWLKPPAADTLQRPFLWHCGFSIFITNLPL
jgi:hypothetical protein